MKKQSLLLLALALCASCVMANPVGENQAKTIGTHFVNAHLGQKSADISLVYTQALSNGEASLYVFNFDDGFVIVSGDDRVSPVLGYSHESQFDTENIPEGLQYFLRHYTRQIQFAVDQDLSADDETMQQWEQLRGERQDGLVRAQTVVNPLLTTTWDQNSPYNYYAPQASGGPGGRCYAGCLATAMSQIMRFWSWPETGVGEHSYSTSTYGGTLSANFGATTYNWNNMPNSISYSSPQDIALLMYHCGISVDMDYKPTGSGAHIEDALSAVVDHFRYGEGIYIKSRDSYTKRTWEDMLIESLDRGIPILYAAVDDNGAGGHAFNCDGYDNERKFHINWGWSNSGNGFFVIDVFNLPYYMGGYHYNEAQRGVFLMVPDYIYESMVPAIESFQVTVSDAMTHTTVLKWTVPTESLSGAPLQNVESIVVKRNGQVIKTYNNLQPGEEIAFEDNVSEYGNYEYKILGINNGIEGETLTKSVIVGPYCSWKIVSTTTSFQGWNDGKILFVGHNGQVFNSLTMTSSIPVSMNIDIPEGDFELQWYTPVTEVSSLTITLKNSNNQTAYNFSGSSSQLNGTIYSGHNDCDGCLPPTALTGEYQYTPEGFGALISWTYDETPQSFKVYRSENGTDYELLATVDKNAREYLDENTVGNYYYKVTAYRSYCESLPAWTADEQSDFVYVEITDVCENGQTTAVYPNPVNQKLTVQAQGITEITLYSILGQQVYQYRGMTDKLDINVAKLESGIYFLQVKTTEGSFTNRITVQH